MKNNRSRRSDNNVIHGHISAAKTGTLSTGLLTLTINDALTTVTSALGQVYRYYRYKRLKFTLFPMNPANNNLLAQFIPSGVSTQSSANNAIEGSHICVLTNTCSVPQSFVVDYSTLMGNHPWFITDGDSSATSAETVGQIFIEGNASESFYYSLEVEYEFKTPADSANIAALLAPEATPAGRRSIQTCRHACRTT